MCLKYFILFSNFPQFQVSENLTDQSDILASYLPKRFPSFDLVGRRAYSVSYLIYVNHSKFFVEISGAEISN